MDKAAKELERAQELFRLQRPEQPWPNWGSIDVFGWLGQVFVRSGKFEAARALYEEALRFEPNHTWIRLELLPVLEALEAAEG